MWSLCGSAIPDGWSQHFERLLVTTKISNKSQERRTGTALARRSIVTTPRTSEKVLERPFGQGGQSSVEFSPSSGNHIQSVRKLCTIRPAGWTRGRRDV